MKKRHVCGLDCMKVRKGRLYHACKVCKHGTVTPIAKSQFAVKAPKKNAKKVVAYHGGSAPIRSFDESKTADGTFWFSEDLDKITRGESGAASLNYLMTVELTVSKVGGWDEYDKYLLDQLRQQGYDALHLDDDWLVFEPKSIKVLSVKKLR